MPQSLSKVIIHIVFSTKNRMPFLNGNIRLKAHAYIATIIRDMNSNAYRVGGTENHVHIACSLARTISQSDFLKKIKSSSSKWIKAQGIHGFYWQKGFGIFSVSSSHLPVLLEYIDNQKEHHKNISFKDEFRKLLKKYNIEYDEKYIWE